MLLLHTWIDVTCPSQVSQLLHCIEVTHLKDIMLPEPFMLAHFPLGGHKLSANGMTVLRGEYPAEHQGTKRAA